MAQKLTPEGLLERVPGSTDHDPGRLTPRAQREVLRLARLKRPDALNGLIRCASGLAYQRWLDRSPGSDPAQTAFDIFGNVFQALLLLPAKVVGDAVDSLAEGCINVMDLFPVELYWCPIVDRFKAHREPSPSPKSAVRGAKAHPDICACVAPPAKFREKGR